MGRSFFLYKRERKEFTKLVIVFDVIRAKNRDIDIADIDMNNVTNDMFVCFYTGFIEKEGYETKKYFTEHPQLSNELLEALLQKKSVYCWCGFCRCEERQRTYTYGSVLCRSWGFYY